MTDTKRCKKCGESFPVASFNKRSCEKDGLEPWCRGCQRAHDRERYRANPEPYKRRAKEWGKEHPESQREYKRRPEVAERTRENAARRRKEKADSLKQYKESSGCVICGYDEHAEALDFHHVDPSDKEIAMYHWQNYRWSEVMNELSKCIVLCANCHRLLHAGLVSAPGPNPGRWFPWRKLVG